MPTNTGYVDLQINGYAGVDFNGDSLNAEEVHNVCRQLRDLGVAGFLPTVITADVDLMAERLARLVSARQSDLLAQEMILGFHIEGPFISADAGFVGAHPPGSVRPADVSLMARLLEAADGLTRIVTLAPEHDDGLRVTGFLADQGVTVAAGHCNPSYELLMEAVDAGLAMFTHLGNGCPHRIVRHDNIIQRVLSLSDSLWISFIADGFHVPYPALRNYLRAATIDRCVIVSDAVSAAGLGPGRFWLCGQYVEIDEDSVPRSVEGSHFVGSATLINEMAKRLRNTLRLSDEDLFQLTSVGPRKILGID